MTLDSLTKRCEEADRSCQGHQTCAVRYNPQVRKLTNLMLLLAVFVQMFWTGVAHGCQQELGPTTGHCVPWFSTAPSTDQGDGSHDGSAVDACSACHLVFFYAALVAEQQPGSDREANVGVTKQLRSSHFAERPDRPKWTPAA